METTFKWFLLFYLLKMKSFICQTLDDLYDKQLIEYNA